MVGGCCDGTHRKPLRRPHRGLKRPICCSPRGFLSMIARIVISKLIGGISRIVTSETAVLGPVLPFLGGPVVSGSAPNVLFCRHRRGTRQGRA